MKPKDMLAELERVAEALQVKVSYESIASSLMRGGLCRVKGQYRIILDKRLAPEERANTLAESLGRFEWDSVDEIKKPTRDLLAYYSARRKGARIGSMKSVKPTEAAPATAAVAPLEAASEGAVAS